MNCTESDKLLAQRVAGDLSTADREHLNTHLQSCNACRTSAAQYEELSRDLVALREACQRVTPPFVFVPGDQEASTGRLRRRLFVLAQGSLSTAAAIVIFMIALQRPDTPDVTRPEAGRTGVVSGDMNLAKLSRLTARIYPGSVGHRHPGVGRGVRSYLASGPTLLTSQRPVTTGPRPIRPQTPSLILKARRQTNVNDEKPDQDHGSALPERDPGDGKFTRRIGSA